MSGDPSDGSESDHRTRVSLRPTRISTVAVLQTALRRIRRDPVLAVPFTVAGVIVALADWLRTHDPIPVATTDALTQSVSVQYSVLPQGTARTVRHIGALIDLKTPYFLWAVGLEVAVPLVVGIAGWLTIARTVKTHSHLGAVSRYLIALIATVSLPQLLGISPVDITNLLIGIVLLAGFLFVLVRLFLFPVFLVTGSGFVVALRQSYRRSLGHGWPIAGLIIVIGLAYWGLASVPIVGGFLSTALVAPVHAVTLGIVFSMQTDGLNANPSRQLGERDRISDGDR